MREDLWRSQAQEYLPLCWDGTISEVGCVCTLERCLEGHKIWVLWLPRVDPVITFLAPFPSLENSRRNRTKMVKFATQFFWWTTLIHQSFSKALCCLNRRNNVAGALLGKKKIQEFQELCDGTIFLIHHNTLHNNFQINIVLLSYLSSYICNF